MEKLLQKSYYLIFLRFKFQYHILVKDMFLKSIDFSQRIGQILEKMWTFVSIFKVQIYIKMQKV